MRWPKQIPENRFLHRSLLYFRIQIQLMPHRLTILNRWKRETGEDDHTLEERQSLFDLQNSWIIRGLKAFIDKRTWLHDRGSKLT